MLRPRLRTSDAPISPFSTRHRILAVQGATREVVVIGDRLHDSTGEVIGTQGFYIDVTPTGEAREDSITEAVAEIAENRAVIEQVKGILLLVTIGLTLTPRSTC